MNIGLVTDSTADIPPKLAKKHQIEVVPAILVLDGKSFADGVNITREKFYHRLPRLQTPPTTAAPSVGSFLARYEKLFALGAEKIFSVHAASSLSGIFNAARLAAESFGGRVQTVDSGQLSLGIGFQILEAAEAIAQGADVEKITALFSTVPKRIELVAALDSLEYLRRSGRVSWAKARMADFLHLKPMIGLADGKVENLGSVRTTRRAETRLLSILRENKEIKQLAILHTNAAERARKFLVKLAPPLSAQAIIVNVTPVIGAHLGPNGIGFSLLRR